VLQKRADALFGMLRLFHGGLEEIANTCSFDRSLLVARLQDILDTLVPMAQNYGDLFGHEPALLLPKVLDHFLQVLLIYNNIL